MKRWEDLTLRSKGTGITEPLSRQVNLLGVLLGYGIRMQSGDEVHALAESLRVACKKAYRDGDEAEREQAFQKIRTLELQTLIALLRAFTTYFHLVNNAEKHEIVRVNREREKASRSGEPRAESIAAGLWEARRSGLTFSEVLKILEKLDIRPTLTAHPTEARRRTILLKQQDLAALLERLQLPDLTARERGETIENIYQHIALLLATDEIRPERVEVMDEVRQGLYFLSTTIWETVPEIYADIEHSLLEAYDRAPAELPVVLRYRTWIGSDRDGNPNVTPEVTWRTLCEQRETVLGLYIEELKELRQDFSLSARLSPPSKELLDSLQLEAGKDASSEPERQSLEQEPYRRKLSQMIARLQANRSIDEPLPAEGDVYRSEDLLSDLKLIRNSLLRGNAADVADYHTLKKLLVRVRTFGFHLAAADIRQHSAIHEQTVADLLRLAGVTERYEQLPETSRVEILAEELRNPRPLAPPWADLSDLSRRTLDTFRLIGRALRRDPDAIGSYIISMTHAVSDMLEVLLLAKETGLWRIEAGGGIESDLDVVPLLETIQDLQTAQEVMDDIFRHPVYREHLDARGGFQEIMLGYSDSNKDGGYWMANWALYQAQTRLAEVCRHHELDYRIFHGRGGTVGRGGGRANQAILALPAASYTGRIRFTEQGEVITFRYALPAIAHRHLEQIVHAMLVAAPAVRRGASVPDARAGSAARAVMQRIASESMIAYQSLIKDERLWSWYVDITPIELISRLPIASRPVSRKSADEVDFESLRAIPWVFGWTQTRYNVPGWFGFGTVLNGIVEEEPQVLQLLQTLYRDWTFFRTVLDNAQLEMARTRLVIAEYYSRLDEGGYHAAIASDFREASEAIRRITDQRAVFDNAPVLKKSICLRNPYTDVLNLIQVELLRRWKSAGETKPEALAHALFLSVNGIAAAMQSTG